LEVQTITLFYHSDYIRVRQTSELNLPTHRYAYSVANSQKRSGSLLDDLWDGWRKSRRVVRLILPGSQEVELEPEGRELVCSLTSRR